MGTESEHVRIEGDASGEERWWAADIEVGEQAMSGYVKRLLIAGRSRESEYCWR